MLWLLWGGWLQLFDLLILRSIRGTPLVPLIYRLLGLRRRSESDLQTNSFCSYLLNTHLFGEPVLESSLIDIDANSGSITVGEDALLVAHSFDNGTAASCLDSICRRA